MKFTCAQRGCEFEADAAPELCPVCNNPLLPTTVEADELPWSEYTVDELLEYCKSWGVDLPGGRPPKDALISALTTLEAAEADEID